MLWGCVASWLCTMVQAQKTKWQQVNRIEFGPMQFKRKLRELTEMDSRPF